MVDALNENTPGAVVGVVDGVGPKPKFVLPDVDEPEALEGAELPRLKGLLSDLVVLLAAVLNGLELSEGPVVVPNGEIVLPVGPPVGPNTEDFPKADVVVPNALPEVPNAGVELLEFVLKAEVVAPPEVPVPKTEPAFAKGEGAATVVPPIPNPVLVVLSFGAVVAPLAPLLEAAGPKVKFEDVVVVPVEVIVFNGLKLNVGFDTSFVSEGVVVVIEAAVGVTAAVGPAAGLEKLKENFGAVVAPVVFADVVPVGVTVLVVAVAATLTGGAGGADVSGFVNAKSGLARTGGCVFNRDPAVVLPKASFFCSEAAPDELPNETWFVAEPAGDTPKPNPVEAGLTGSAGLAKKLGTADV